MRKQAVFDFWNFLGPKHWLTWFGLGFLRLLAFLPFRIQNLLSRPLSRLYYHLDKKRRHVAKVNLGLCFPDKTPQQRHELLLKTFHSTTMGIFETINAWWASDRRLKNSVITKGLEYIDEAYKKNKGILIIGAHYTTVQLSGRLMSLYRDDLQPFYKKAHNPLFEAIMTRVRKRTYKNVIENKSVAELIQTLKENNVCWYAPDQDFGKEATVFSPFFNVPAASLVVPGVLARITKATVLSMYSQRLDNGKYLIEISPIGDNFPAENNIESATVLNQTLEKNISRAPEQYLWLHRRFKTRPPGEDNVY